MKFDYVKRITADDELDIEDTCNFTIRAYNDMGDRFYLTSHSDMGNVIILECGPISDVIVPGQARMITWNYYNMSADKKKINRIIENFLNNQKRVITQAEVCEFEDIKDELINPLDLIEE